MSSASTIAMISASGSVSLRSARLLAPALKPASGRDVDEPQARLVAAVLLDRLPGGRVRSVVVEDDDLEVRVVLRLDGLDGRQQDLRRLVVGHDVDRNHRLVRRIRDRERPRAAGAAHDITDVADVGVPHHERAEVEHDEQRCREGLADGPRGAQGDVGREPEEREPGRQERRVEDLADDAVVGASDDDDRREDHQHEGGGSRLPLPADPR